jgi:hypothetical protein
MKSKRLLDRAPPRTHYWRAAATAAVMLAGALFIGMLGYRFLNGERWVDAFLDAAMILGGMGPVSAMRDDAAKIFAGCYALFSGLIFVGSAAVLVAPWLHAVLHRLHAEPEAGSRGR